MALAQVSRRQRGTPKCAGVRHVFIVAGIPPEGLLQVARKDLEARRKVFFHQIDDRRFSARGVLVDLEPRVSANS